MFPFSTYDPTVKATIVFLKLLKVKVNNETIDETLQNHPDWPSLLCISDSFSKWKIPNAAGRIDKNELDALPLPFLAHTSDPEFPIIIVTNVTEGIVSYLAGENYLKEKKQTKENFLNTWNGIYFIAEPATDSGETDFEANRKKQVIKRAVPVLLVIALGLFMFLILQNAVRNMNLSGLSIYIQFVLLLTGVIVTSLLLWYEIDKNSPALKKVCTGIAKGNCDAILSSKQAKVFSWLSWSEVGFFYFTGSLLNLVFSSSGIVYANFLLAWISLLALPYIFFSIYFQWRVAKQWCVLCLCVQGLLFLLALNSVVFYQLDLPFHNVPISYSGLFLFLFGLPVLVWYTIKPSLQKLQKAKAERREYMRVKFNKDIFDTLLKKQKQLSYTTDDLGIVLGNPNAPHELIKVCNPYCGPCSKAHPEIEKLLEQNNNLRARIIFTATNDENDQSVFPVKHFLAVACDNDEAKIKQALDDWYLSEKKEYDVFAAKYPVTTPLEQQEKKVEQMSVWCTKEKIMATPTIFINGNQIPDAYSIRDLQYFLLE